MIRNSMPTKSVGSACLAWSAEEIVGDLEPGRVEIELVRLDFIDQRLFTVSSLEISFAFIASTSS